MKNIGACIIAKDEAHVIKRCLASIKPLVDYILVVDTGSSDNTPEEVWGWMLENNMPGEIRYDTWVNFAENRSRALAYLQGCSWVDYALIIDADEVLEYAEWFNPDVFKGMLDADLYDIKTKYSGIEYCRPQLLKNSLPFYYRGVVHEFIECGDFAATRGTAEGLWNMPVQDGARSKDPDKFLKDAFLLEKALVTERDPFLRTRYTFYLAQSLMDAGASDRAKEKYLERAGMGGWDQEVYISLMRAGQIEEAEGWLMKQRDEECEEAEDKFDKAARFYEDAEILVPSRIEASFRLSQLFRKIGSPRLAYISAAEAVRKKQPDGALFMEKWVYDWGAKDELAVCAYGVAEYEECAKLCEEMLARGDLPQQDRNRIEDNLRFAKEKIDGRKRRNIESTN